jgi:serine protease Do
MTHKPRWPFAAAGLALGIALGAGAAGTALLGQPQPAPAPALPRELTSYSSVVKTVLPAVVSIDAKAQRRPRRNGDEPDAAERKREAELGFGSGVLIAADGVVPTNLHVVDGADAAEVQLNDGRKFLSQDIRGDRLTDLAVVRLAGLQNAPFLRLGDSDQMEIGDRVLAVGAPFGLTGSVTHGIISAKSRDLRLNLYEDFLQTDAAINPGNSGGPLVNLAGEVIGINAAIKSRSGGFQGVGLAVSSNMARKVVDGLLKDGVVKRGYLGIKMDERDIDAALAQKLGLKSAAGVLVEKVFAGGPGAGGGLQAGDVIVGIAGKPVRDGRELQRVVAWLPVGAPTEVQVVRDGKPLKLSLTLTQRPDERDAKP